MPSRQGLLRVLLNPLMRCIRALNTRVHRENIEFQKSTAAFRAPRLSFDVYDALINLSATRPCLLSFCYFVAFHRNEGCFIIIIVGWKGYRLDVVVWKN